MNKTERGKRLGDLRRAAGLLQRQVGAKFDIDKAAVASWEAGKSAPDRRKLLKLDELYDADGEVLRLFDVATSLAGRDEEIAELRSQLADVIEDLNQLRDAVALLGAATVPASRSTQRPGAATSGGH